MKRDRLGKKHPSSNILNWRYIIPNRLYQKATNTLYKDYKPAATKKNCVSDVTQRELNDIIKMVKFHNISDKTHINNGKSDKSY